ncbi:MAG: hypothetical protein ACXV79_07915 [Methylobacter sp.]
MYICGLVVFDVILFKAYMKSGRRNLCAYLSKSLRNNINGSKRCRLCGGQSIKDNVLERVFQPLSEINTSNEEEVLRQLEAFLKPCVDAAEQGPVINKSVQQIFEETHQEEMR